MNLSEMLLEQLEAEAPLSRKALEKVPEGKYDWKPHPKSMAFGPLASLVATMPTWVGMIVNMDELDVTAPRPAGASKPRELTSRELVATLEDGVQQARTTLRQTTDAHLMTPWKLILPGGVVDARPRYAQLRDGLFSHLAHHRGQMTVYLRLIGVPVPALYGPSADEAMQAPV
jgi:uncharacterized damage-inducible protein DinB